MANKQEQLDSELLQVAGQSGPGAAGNNTGGLSDISEDDISDVNDDGRSTMMDNDDVDISDDDDEFLDEERLARMTELEREMELAERAERQQQKRQREELLKAAGGRRRSGREVREENKKKSAIEELKAARERKARGEKAVFEEPDEEEVEAEPVSLGGDEDEIMSEDDIVEQHDDDEEASYQEVKGIQVRRYKLEEWYNKPFFEKTLPGCIVRLAAGNKKAPDGHTMYGSDGRPVVQYMAARVAGLVEKEPGYYKYLNQSAPPWKSPYPFGPKGEKTSIWLRVVRGNSEKIWPLAQVSNSSITEQEFYRYHQQCEENGVGQITRNQVERARARLVEAENYVFTETDVARLIEEKRLKGAGSRRNAALEKARLERERDAAKQRGDTVLVDQLDSQIQEIQASMEAARKKDSLAELNKKNASINFKTTMMAEQQNNDDATGGDTMLDPFRRRVTRPVVYWNTAGAVDEKEHEQAPQSAEEQDIEEVNGSNGEGLQGMLDRCVYLLHARRNAYAGNAVANRLCNLNSDRKRKFASRKFLDQGDYTWYSIDEYEMNALSSQPRRR
mmetsp:Transcript_3353/g.6744  ORF Transcript_3353/g.6744 Transcript_3353/m.6744 type:complete len:562 (+) Transcript_3353:8880-10565(+)